MYPNKLPVRPRRKRRACSSCIKEDFEEQLYEGSEAVRSHGGGGTVEKSQLFDNAKRVGAINAFMKICGPDINGGSSS